MNQETMLTSNSINLTGEVISRPEFSHEVYGEGFYKFNINVQRLSDTSDVLPVTISERLIDKEELIPGTIVTIQGQVRSYNNFVEDEHKTKLILTVFARNIIISPETIPNNPNEVYLNGFICKPTIYRVTPFSREISDMLIAVNRSYNKSDYIPCIAWGRNAKFSSKLNVGDNVKVWGRMQSRKYQKKISDTEVVDKVAYELSLSKIELVKNTIEENAEEVEE